MQDLNCLLAVDFIGCLPLHLKSYRGSKHRQLLVAEQLKEEKV